MSLRNLNDYDSFDDYETDMKFSDRKARRARKPRVSGNPKKSTRQVIEQFADLHATEGEFTVTYKPAKHEAVWLMSSLQAFFDQDLITDVLAVVKGGKEASVYRCAGKLSGDSGEGASTLVAAKVYRPRMFRNLRNDQMYREGRQLLTEEGRIVKTSDHRVMRAVGKKTAFGAQVSHTSWLMYEYQTMKHLYNAGAAVPQPIASAENAILMSYVGDESRAAPTLHEVGLTRNEALPLFFEVLRNIELMLSFSMIHGDLSAYNILYWEGKITLIDFPQVTNPQGNRNAYQIFKRDVERVCDYFEQWDVRSNPRDITDKLWDKHIKPKLPPLDIDFDFEDPDNDE